MPSARRAAMKARTSAGASLSSARERRRLPPRCSARKARNWPDVARIGLDRLRRHPPLGAEDARASAPTSAATSEAANGMVRRAGSAIGLIRVLDTCGHNHTRFLHPSLSAPESARSAAWPTRVSSMSWCRSRSTRPIPTVPAGLDARARRHRCGAARPARGASAWSGRRTSMPNPRLRQPPEGHRRQARRAAAARPSCAGSSTGCRTTRCAPRGMVLRMALRMGEHLGPARERVGVRLAGPPPKRMTAARKRVLRCCADGLVRAQGRGRARRPACRPASSTA